MHAAVVSSLARSKRSRRVVGVSVVAVVTGVCVGLAVLLVLSASRLSPFPNQTTEGNDAVVLTKIQNLARFEAATGHFQTLVDQTRSNDHLPGWVSGERNVLAAEGDVEATVDLSKLPAGAIQVSSDGKHATVHLPAPTLSEPRLDPKATRMVGHEAGIIDRVGDGLTGGDPAAVAELQQRAASKLSAAAEQSDLKERARVNTEHFLRDTLRSTGVDDVTVVFDPTPGAGA